MLAELDLMLRGAVVGTAAVVAMVLCCDPAARAKSWSVVLITIALAGDMAVAQGMTAVWSPGARDLAEMARALMPIALTWFILDVFMDRSDYGPREIGMLAFAGVMTVLCMIAGTPKSLHLGFDLVLFAWVLWVVVSTAKGDLVNRRRQFRVSFVTLLVLFGIGKTTTELLIAPADRPEWYGTLYAMGVLVFVGVFARWVLSPQRDICGCAPAERKPAKRPTASESVDHQVVTRIEAAMRDEFWRRESLSIGDMASELGIPEHRLRRAINTDLGFRNFSTFVNGYRIEAAKAALGNPANAGRTILEIAYEVGFASLGPFNRAFRAETGQSPSDFRRAPGHAGSSLTAAE